MSKKISSDDFQTIEKTEDGFDIFEYGEYESSSVLAGQTRKSFLDTFETLEAAKKAYPKAEVGGGFDVNLNLGYLPDENGNTYTKEGYDL